jgi:hypothetical protein
LGWGERGHDLVTRVAVRLVDQRAGAAQPAYARLLRQKEHMLGHLANVPDIVWRGMDAKVRSANGPTHYIDLEYVRAGHPEPHPNALPASAQQLREAIAKTCKQDPKNCAPGEDMAAKIAKTGHAPLRILQLWSALEQEFRKIASIQKQSKTMPRSDKRAATAAMNRALGLAGLLSHFVADLGNPLHTTKNYDGRLTGQGGLHAYFETHVVNALSLRLSHEVYQEAQSEQPFAKLIKKVKPQSRAAKVWALVVDSHQRIDDLFAMDRQLSLVKKGDRILAGQRREAEIVAPKYQAFITSRLAMAADALAHIWLAAWQAAGEPDISFYHSYHYDVRPAFIDVDYLPLKSADRKK